MVFANIDSCLLKNEDLSSQPFLLFFPSVKESIHYSTYKMTSGQIMKNGALDAERSKFYNTNRCLYVTAKAGFSLSGSVISRILSHCAVPHKDICFLFTCFEIILTMMHL